MNSKESLIAKDLQYIWHPCSQMKDYEELPPIMIDHAKGTYLYDIHGKRYIDIISSWWCNLLGHCNPHISDAIKKQLDKLEHVIFANFTHEGAVLLCERLMKHLPHGLTKFNFSDNGSASIECALKMSFQYQYQTGHPEKKHFMTLSDGYHGETVGALSVGGLDLYAEIYKPMLMDVIHVEAPNCYRCPYKKHRDSCSIECFEKVKKAFALYAKETCAFICEPLLQGSAGMRMYPPQYLRALRDLCTEYDVIMIADEIATGFGRTGTFFACNQASVAPDIMCLSKGLTGGYMPMALTITTPKIYDAFYADYLEGKAFMHSHTYSGNPLGCAAALAVLDVLENESIIEKAKEKAAYLHALLVDTLGTHPYVGEIRHLGMINAIELVADVQEKTPFDSKKRTGYQIYKKALSKGLLLRPLGDVLYFNPPLTISLEEIQEAVSICKEALLEILPE